MDIKEDLLEIEVYVFEGIFERWCIRSNQRFTLNNG